MWKNIPDIVLSVDTCIRQQLLPTKIYKKEKLKEDIANTLCRICSLKQESVSHILCACSNLAQSYYKFRHDRMLRPIYHYLLHKYEFDESNHNKPWYKQDLPSPCVENSKAKILWDIPWLIEKCPQNGANKPDISVQDKTSKEWLIIEGTICTPGLITERKRSKMTKYLDLKTGIKELYPQYKVVSVEIVFDFLGFYNTELHQDMNKIVDEKKDVDLLLQQSQKWIISQNCEIVKKFYNTPE